MNAGNSDANVKIYNRALPKIQSSIDTSIDISDHLETNIKLPNKPCKPISEIVTPRLRRRTPILRVTTNSVSQLSTVKNVAPFTPQPPSDPTFVLKKKLKIKMEEQIKEKVALMPPSSPYSLIADITTVSIII